MKSRAVFVVTLGLVVGGCYASHEPGDARDGGGDRADGSVRVDASRDPPDARVLIDGGACALDAPGVSIRVEPVTSDRSRCEPTRVAGIAITGVEPAPADSGIRIHADYCPDADADCRCDIVVANAGVDLASEIRPAVGLTIELSESFVSITQLATCECLGCACSLELVLFAMDGLFEPLPHAVPDLEVAQGDTICEAPSACESGTYALSVRAVTGEAQLRRGTDAVLGSIHVRSVRDVDIFGPCAACASCGSPRASFVAWNEL